MKRLLVLVSAAALLASALAASAAAQEIVESPPAPPTGLQVDAVGDSGITVSWQAAASGTTPTGYKVRVNPDCAKRKTKTVDAGTLSVTFGKVKFCQTYKVWVRAQSDTGQSAKLETTWQRPQQGQEDGGFRGGARVTLPDRQTKHIYFGGTGDPMSYDCLYYITFSVYKRSQPEQDTSRTGSWGTGPCIHNTNFGMYWKVLEEYAATHTKIAGVVFCTSHHKAIEAGQKQQAGNRNVSNLATITC